MGGADAQCVVLGRIGRAQCTVLCSFCLLRTLIAACNSISLGLTGGSVSNLARIASTEFQHLFDFFARVGVGLRENRIIDIVALDRLNGVK